MTEAAQVPPPSVQPGRRRRRRLILLIIFAVITLVVGGPLALFLHHRYATHKELQDVLTQFDLNDEGWRLDDIERNRAVIPPEENSALCVLAARKLISEKWLAKPSNDKMGKEDGKISNELVKPYYFADAIVSLPPEVQLDPEQVGFLRERLALVDPALEEAYKLYQAGMVHD